MAFTNLVLDQEEQLLTFVGKDCSLFYGCFLKVCCFLRKKMGEEILSRLNTRDSCGNARKTRPQR
uniref:hypothetical protein n=2 Tax=unclassified Niallia TaxID=2837522 RepID=UPI0040439678